MPHNPSSGPWLPNWFCCPARSSLTMATSEPLDLPRGLCIMPLGWLTQAPEGPQFTLRVCAIVPSSVPRRTQRLLKLVLRRRSCLRPIRRGLGVRISTHVEFTWSCNEVVSGSLSLRPDDWLALPRPGRLRSRFHPLGRPTRTSSITTRFPVNYRGRSPTG